MTTTAVRYPAPLGLRVKCNRPGRQSPVWARFEGRTGQVVHNRHGEIEVELDGSAGTVFCFLANELVKDDMGGVRNG